MKSKKIVVGAIACLILLAVVGAQLEHASARIKTLGEILGLEPGEIEVGPYEPPSEESTSNSVLITSEQEKTNDEILAEAIRLITLANDKYITPGWLHIVSQAEDFVVASPTLPDGSPTPTHAVNSNWMLLDENGIEIEGVIIDDTGNPSTSQTVIFQNGISTNLSLGMSIQDTDKQRISLDSGFISLATYYNDIVTLSVEESELDGEKVMVFSLTEKFKEPVALDMSPTTIVGSLRKYYISTESGVLLKLERYSLYPNGEEQLVRQIITLLIEKVDAPPAEIMRLLGK